MLYDSNLLNLNKLLKSDHYNPILVAISGGKDSIFLIDKIHNIIQKNSIYIEIEYIYIDHQWKNDSKMQIMHLINYIYSKKQTIFIYQIKHPIIKENIARNLRYSILIEHAKHKNCHTIITAHNLNDTLETFLINIIRGTSIDGCTSLMIQRNIKKNIKLLRPILNIYDADIKFHCIKYLLPIWSDVSNYYMNIYRNRLRHEFIPYLTNYFNQSIEHQITKFIQHCLIDNEYIKQNTLKLYITSSHSIYSALHYNKIQHQHKALQYRILQLFFIHHLNNIINQNMIIKIHTTLKQHKNKSIIKFNNIQIVLQNGWLYIT